MANNVDFDIEDINQFRSSIEQLRTETEDILQRMNAALMSVQNSWQDSQLDKPAENIMLGNNNLSRAICDLYPFAIAYLNRQEAWWESYTSN